jgi:hypothetical protein
MHWRKTASQTQAHDREFPIFFLAHDAQSVN